MSVQNLESITEHLLRVIVNLPKNEFENFVSHARRLKKREESLLAKLETFDLSAQEQTIYRKLLRKFRAARITPEEHQQLIDLTEKLESLNVVRLECLVEVAKIRRKTLSEVMQELNIKPKNYA